MVWIFSKNATVAFYEALDAVYWHHAQVMRGSLFSLLTQECILKS